MLETNLPSTSQDFTITSEHAPNPAQEREQHQILLTLLRPAMLRVDELVTIQSESMRMQREMMGVILSLTLRLDAMATTRSQSVDDRRPELDQIDRNGKKSMNEEENEHRQRCHCGINDTLKESISRGVAEAKAALLTSINALSDRLDASSTDIGKLLKLHSPPSSTLSQHKLDSQVVATDSSPTSRKRRRVDFEREDIMMDGTDQNPPLHMLSQSNATLDDKSKRTVIELQTKKHSIENEELTDAGTGVTGETERFRGSFPEPERHLGLYSFFRSITLTTDMLYFAIYFLQLSLHLLRQPKKKILFVPMLTTRPRRQARPLKQTVPFLQVLIQLQSSIATQQQSIMKLNTGLLTPEVVESSIQ